MATTLFNTTLSIQRRVFLHRETSKLSVLYYLGFSHQILRLFLPYALRNSLSSRAYGQRTCPAHLCGTGASVSLSMPTIARLVAKSSCMWRRDMHDIVGYRFPDHVYRLLARGAIQPSVCFASSVVTASKNQSFLRADIRVACL